MKQSLYIDPRIRDNVFIPIVILMLLVTLLRYYVTKIMYTPSSPLLEKLYISYKLLRKTVFEKYADIRKEPNEKEFDLTKALEEIKDDVKDK